jgi:hypothetical protein
VTAQDFEFAIDVADAAARDAMLRALAGQVMNSLGCGAAAAAPLLAGLAGAIDRAGASAAPGCRVRFERRGGTVEIEVSSNAGRLWHATEPIP